MNNNIININNYEAYLLDKIEGNLSIALTKELDIFLKNNGLEDVHESDLVYLDESDLQNPMSDLYLMSEDLKHYQPSLSEEKIMFEAVEGNIEEEVEKKFKAWIASDVILNQHYQAMLATRSTVENDLIYPNKSKLKRREPIVRYLNYLAAACFLGVLILFGLNQISDTNTDHSFTQTEIKNAGQKKIELPEKVQENDVNTSEQNQLVTNNSPESETTVTTGDSKTLKSGTSANGNISQKITGTNQVINNGTQGQIVHAPNTQDVNSDRKTINSLPKIVRLGSDRVVSNIPKSATVNIYQNKRNEEGTIATGPINSIKEKIDYLDRKSAAIYGFADYQKNIIKSEGLLEVSKDRNADGRVEGYSLRIAGFELTTAR